MTSRKPTLAAPIAPEDIRRGIYVAVLHVIDQCYPCWFDRPWRDAPINIRMLPDDEPRPLRVIEVCLPFVTALRPNGTVTTLDVRRHELARLDDAYARRVVKRLRAPRRQREKSERRKRGRSE